MQAETGSTAHATQGAAVLGYATSARHACLQSHPEAEATSAMGGSTSALHEPRQLYQTLNQYISSQPAPHQGATRAVGGKHATRRRDAHTNTQQGKQQLRYDSPGPAVQLIRTPPARWAARTARWAAMHTQAHNKENKKSSTTHQDATSAMGGMHGTMSCTQKRKGAGLCLHRNQTDAAGV